MASGPAMETVLMWGGLATAVTGVGTLLWRLVRGLARTGRRVDQFMDDWYGEPDRPGVPARPGMMERVSGIEERLDRAETEQTSLRGAVDQANRRLARLCPDPGDPDRPPGS